MSNSHASIAQREWLSVARPKRDLDAQSDQRNETQPVKLAIDSPHLSSVDEGQVASDRPSIVGRIFRLPLFLIAVLIGIGATLGWQSYGDAAREIIVEHIPTLASVLPLSTMKSPNLAATSTEMVQQLLPLTLGINVMRRSVDQLVAKQEQLAQNIAVRRPSRTPPSSSLNCRSLRRSRGPCTHRQCRTRLLEQVSSRADEL